MAGFIQKTFGGLSASYYARQFFFGALFAVLIFYISTRGGRSMDMGLIVLTGVNTFLYPYSRFVYESIISFIFGESVFAVNAILFLMVKSITMALCWAFAIFVAPFGLAYLYFYHSRPPKE